MKLSELIAAVGKTGDSYVSFEDICREVGVGISDYYINIEDDIKSYFTKANWICTDTTVGIRVYYLHDELIAVSSQSGRKMSEEFYWISKETFNKTRRFILGKMEEGKHDFVLANLNEDVSGWLNVKIS